MEPNQRTSNMIAFAKNKPTKTHSMRMIYRQKGDHMHIDIFVGPMNCTRANCGQIVMRAEEFQALKFDRMDLVFAEDQT